MRERELRHLIAAERLLCEVYVRDCERRIQQIRDDAAAQIAELYARAGRSRPS